jgi:hypothetical protein
MKYNEKELQEVKEKKIGHARNFKPKGLVTKMTETFYIYESKINKE